MKKKYFPLFVDLSEKHAVVIGGGRIAYRRIKSLSEFAGSITVFAPNIADELIEFANREEIEFVEREYNRDCLDDADIVFAATDNKAVNRQIYTDAKLQHLPVNVCDDPTLCDFYFPAIVEKDQIIIGITSSGSDHKRVKEIRQRIDKVINTEV